MVTRCKSFRRFRGVARLRRIGAQPGRVAQVAQVIRERIFDGTLAAQAALPPQGELAETLGVSRTVVREAMSTLAAEGLLEVSQGRLPRVREPDGQAAAAALRALVRGGDNLLLHLVEVRAPLEGEIAALAARRHGPADRAALEQAIADLKQAGTRDDQVAADVRFHTCLAEASGNPLFGVILAAVNELLRLSRRRTIARSGVAKAVNDHRRILRCVVQRDGAAARRAMRGHLKDARADLLKVKS